MTGIFVFSVCQGQHNAVNVFALAKKKYYTEHSLFLTDSQLVLYQETSFNEPRTIDEEYSIILRIRLSDTAKAKQAVKLDLAKDSAIIACTFFLVSSWEWDTTRKPESVKGTITFQQWTDKKIKALLDLEITGYRNLSYLYKGSRIYEITDRKLNNFGILNQ